MSSIAAPVVPMNEASTPPTARKIVLLRGVALMSPTRKIPPEATKRLPMSMMNWKYSTRAWMTVVDSPLSRNHAAIGTPRTSATMSLTRLRSQIFSVAGMSGSTAMHPRSRTNGMMLHQATTIRGLLYSLSTSGLVLSTLTLSHSTECAERFGPWSALRASKQRGKQLSSPRRLGRLRNSQSRRRGSVSSPRRRPLPRREFDPCAVR